MRIDFQKVINFWLKTADLKWETAKSLKRSKKFADCLFFCHLVLESLLKALVCKKRKIMPPYSHHLVELAALAGLEMTLEQKAELRVINSFNIHARYDTYKHAFYKRATKEFAEKHFNACKTWKIWLSKKLHE